MDQPYQQNQPEEVSNVPANIPNLSSDAPNTPSANSNVPPAYPHAPAENPFASPVFQNPACVPPVTRIRQTATGRDVVFAILCAVFCILCADNYLWGGASLGASLSTVCLLLTGIIYLGHRIRRLRTQMFRRLIRTHQPKIRSRRRYSKIRLAFHRSRVSAKRQPEEMWFLPSFAPFSAFSVPITIYGAAQVWAQV